MEKNLGNEFEDAVKELRALIFFCAVRDGVDFIDGSNPTAEEKACRVAVRFLRIYCEMFKRQEALMTKLDKVLDLYLEQNKK